MKYSSSLSVRLADRTVLVKGANMGSNPIQVSNGCTSILG